MFYSTNQHLKPTIEFFLKWLMLCRVLEEELKSLVYNYIGRVSIIGVFSLDGES